MNKKQKDLINELLEKGLFEYLSERINDDLTYLSTIDFKYKFSVRCAKDELLFKTMTIKVYRRLHINIKIDLQQFVNDFIQTKLLNNLKFKKVLDIFGNKILYDKSRKLYKSIFSDCGFEQPIEFNEESRWIEE